MIAVARAITLSLSAALALAGASAALAAPSSEPALHPIEVPGRPWPIASGIDPHPVVGIGAFDVVVDLRFPAPSPAPAPVGTPNPNPTFVQAPRYNVGGACAELTVVLSKVYGYAGQPGQPQAVLTTQVGSVTPLATTGLGLACVAAFTGVATGSQYYATLKYGGAPIQMTPVGGWSNPFTFAASDPNNAVTGTPFREMSVAVP